MASTEVDHVSDARALVAATSLETGRFAATEQSVDGADLAWLLDQLSTIEQGYAEVRLADEEFPALLAGFRKGLAVVQCMSNPESTALLAGDGSVAGPELVDVLIMDDLAPFSGEYVLQSARARDVLLTFAEGADVRSLGQWHEL